MVMGCGNEVEEVSPINVLSVVLDHAQTVLTKVSIWGQFFILCLILPILHEHSIGTFFKLISLNFSINSK